MKTIFTSPTVSMRPTRLEDVWFQHETSRKLSFIVPPSYRDLLTIRSQDMDSRSARRYVDDRTIEEDGYRTSLGIENDLMSFTYATIVGFHHMGKADDYPGYTYFFKLTPDEVSQTLFGVVSGDQVFDLSMERGLRALERALTHWNRQSDKFHSIVDQDLGSIEPRIEVAISFPVRPLFVIPQVEDRPVSKSVEVSSTTVDRKQILQPGNARFE